MKTHFAKDMLDRLTTLARLTRQLKLTMIGRSTGRIDSVLRRSTLLSRSENRHDPSFADLSGTE
jgi:hypothetical protein